MITSDLTQLNLLFSGAVLTVKHRTLIKVAHSVDSHIRAVLAFG